MDQSPSAQTDEAELVDPNSGLTTGLPNYAYTSEDFFAREQTELFAKTWTCIGNACNVPEPGDLRPVDFLDQPPVMLPLAQEIGMNEIHFCIMMVTSLGVGFITPPLGLNLFVVSGLTGEPTLKVAARAVPYVFAMAFVVCYWPSYPSYRCGQYSKQP
jgi:hypothetical protein